ncbi:hypothetical protein J6590_015237 [Homalodisca vitripennis]|nr:hypothetical protein J6590_015237 [Homalodisca vitripennis]
MAGDTRILGGGDSAITLSTRPLDYDLCLRMGRDKVEAENVRLRQEMSQMSRPRNTSDQGECLSFNTSGSTAGSNVVGQVSVSSKLKLVSNMRENIQHFRNMLSNYSLATRLCDEDHSVQVASMMSAIGDEVSRIINKLMDEPERTTVSKVVRVMEQKLTPELNIRYTGQLIRVWPT